MLVKHVFDFALVVRSRRRQLKLRQIELARAAGVSREWISDCERGKPTLEFDKVLRTLDVLNVPIGVDIAAAAPGWSTPFTLAAAVRERHLSNLRPRRRRVPRLGPKPPERWG